MGGGNQAAAAALQGEAVTSGLGVLLVQIQVAFNFPTHGQGGRGFHLWQGDFSHG